MSSAAEFELRDRRRSRRRAETMLGISGATFTPMMAGVSSDLWRIDAARQDLLPEARVATAQRGEGMAGAGSTQRRGSSLVAVCRHRRAAPGTCRRRRRRAVMGFAILSWFDPARWTNWKQQLMHGTGASRRRHRNGRTARGAASARARSNRNSRRRSTTWICCRRCASSRSSSPRWKRTPRSRIDCAKRYEIISPPTIDRADPRRRQPEERTDPHLAAAGAARRGVCLLGRSRIRRSVSVRAPVPEIGASDAIPRMVLRNRAATDRRVRGRGAGTGERVCCCWFPHC